MDASVRNIILASLDPAVRQWRNAVVVAGGDVSASRLQIVSAFVRAERACGSWDLTDDYWGLWAENAPQSLVSLKQRRLAVAVNAPTFVVDRHYLFDGVSNYITTGFIGSTHAIAGTPTNNRVAVYDRVDLTAAGYSVGANASLNRLIRLRTRSSGSMSSANATDSMSFLLPVADARGYAASSRNGVTAADCLGYKNGVAMARSADPTVFAVGLPNIDLWIGGYNNSAVIASPRAGSTGFVAIGASLSPAQELAQYNNVQAWATSIGANV